MVQLEIQFKNKKERIMAKKTTWQDAKKKKEKIEAELDKLLIQDEQLQDKIKAKRQALREAEAEYFIELRNNSQKSDADLERFFLSNHHNPSVPHQGGN